MLPDSFIHKVIADLEQDEGFRSKPYVCPAGKLTIGYGRNLEDKGITNTEALILLRNDIVDAHLNLRQFFPEAEKLSDNRYRVILEMVFVLGISGFLKFKHFIRCVKDYNFQGAADEILDSEMGKQIPNRTQKWAQIFRED